jgi:Flp pilus assembly protein TadB
MKEIYAKSKELREALNDYLRIIYEKAKAKEEAIKLKAILQKAKLEFEKYNEEEIEKMKETYEKLIETIEKYETMQKILKENIYSTYQELKKLVEYLPKEEKKKDKTKTFEFIFSISAIAIFLAALNYFRIISKALETIGYSSLPKYSFNFLNLLLSIIVFALLIIAFKTSLKK